MLWVITTHARKQWMRRLRRDLADDPREADRSLRAAMDAAVRTHRRGGKDGQRQWFLHDPPAVAVVAEEPTRRVVVTLWALHKDGERDEADADTSGSDVPWWPPGDLLLARQRVAAGRARSAALVERIASLPDGKVRAEACGELHEVTERLRRDEEMPDPEFCSAIDKILEDWPKWRAHLEHWGPKSDSP